MANKNKETDYGRRRFLRNIGILSGAGVIASCGVKPTNDDNDTPQSGEMTMRVNPNTGDRVSLLGYGCMRLPTLGMANGTEDTTIDQEAVNQSVDYALKHGVNYFDTSPVYCQGQSEKVMGIALSRYPRDSYYIATKLSNFAEQIWPREKSIEMFENSLKNLRTDYIDYLLLHSVGQGGMERFSKRYLDNGILDFLKERRTDGTIRNLGFSYHGDIAVFDYLLELMDKGEIHWDFVQIQLNYIDWHFADETNPVNTDAVYLYGELHKRGIPSVIMEPLLGGRLATVSQPIAAKMKARRPDDSIATWAFRYAGTPEDVLTVLSGMTYMEHLQENLKTFSPLDPITDDEDAFLQRIAVEIIENKEIPCTDCKYCMPCPYGVDIPTVFKHYNKCIKNDNMPRNATDPRYNEARKAFLYGYDLSVPRLRQADRCIGCGECKLHCPQNINIPDMMAKIDSYTDNLRKNK
ncbi:MAG: aldo/keto reductase [Muribaculaceae bacterium]|nr:aldo/keto reductase [Muribaculaceae bacterium]